MATVVKDLGAVTAYAYAVAGGYSGTEAEFEALLGNIAEDLSEIENLSVTVTTLPAGSSATASYSNGVLSLGIPKGDKGDKGDTGATGATGPTGNGISTITKTGTSGLVDTYTITFTNGDTTTFTVTNGEDGEVTTAQMNAAIETALEDYAKVDGSYSSLTAGNAEQIVSTVGVTDKTPYLFRTTGGSADVGDRVKVSEITGGTVAWNQICPSISDFSGRKCTISVSDGVCTMTPNADGVSNGRITLANSSASNADVVNGHKYFMSFSIKSAVPLTSAWMLYSNNLNNNTASIIANAWNTVAAIKSTNSNSSKYFQVDAYGSFALTDTVDVKNIMCIDLTAMFGSTIADYLYTLESGTAGAGVAKLKSWGFCTKPYYAYDAGSLLSVKTTAHKEVGFNAYDNTTGKAKVVGGQVYQITGTYTSLSLDGTSITPDASGYFTPAADGELTVTGGNATDTCIHLKWDGERDGEYEPYEANTYPLDDVELRGIPKLDASNNLYYDGDGYAPDGTVTRKYGIVDLGTLTYALNNHATLGDYFYADITSLGVKYAGDFISVPSKFNAVTRKYTLASRILSSFLDKTFCFDGSEGDQTVTQIQIKDSAYSDAATFKTAMSGVYLVYELATPTTESADPYQETQVCNDFGTEEFVDSRTVPMPVGANALYQTNLRAKLEMAPDSPDGDGDYIVRQTDGLNEYVAVSNNSTISGLSTRCPACPTDTDGTFVLKATVSSGTVTYAWTAE